MQLFLVKLWLSNGFNKVINMTALQTGFEYTDINIDGDRIVMTERECPTGTKFLIGNRFFFFVQTFDANKAFDFFRN